MHLFSESPEAAATEASPGRDSIDERVADEQVRALYGHGVVVLLANVVNATIVSIALWNTEPHSLLLGWTGAIAFMVALRWQVRRAYLRATRASEELPRWTRAALTGTFVAGVLWGGGGVLFVTPSSPTSQLVMAFVLGGMVASAAGTLACYLPAFYAFLFPAMLPLIVKLAMAGDGAHYAMSAMAMLYAVLIARVAQGVNGSIVESLRLRFENLGLIEELDTARKNLLGANADLEERVRERTLQIESYAEERDRLIRATASQQRLESLGRLAGGVAHDFNNALSVVLGGTEALRTCDDAEEQRQILDDIEQSARNASSTARQLLTFSRGNPTAEGTSNPRQVLERFAVGLRRMLPENITFSTECTGDDLIALPEGLLEQTLLNLVSNARDAMGGGGALTLRSRTVGEEVVIEVIDSGIGMDEATRARIFEPFFTTKGEKAVGLGLATVWGTVIAAGGTIDVDSAPDKGASFRIAFPRRAPPPAAVADPAAVSRASAQRPARVLLLEDEAGVRRVLERTLAKAGHEVSSHEVAATARRALETEEFDCLLTDSVVPGGGVGDLIQRFVATHPGAPVLVCSGYVREQLIVEGIEADAYRFIEKPFRSQDVLAAIDEALRARA
ncbi:MAG: ATP-binding protein [Labilithrix sp.]